jgi:hypothetical protein
MVTMRGFGTLQLWLCNDRVFGIDQPCPGSSRMRLSLAGLVALGIAEVRM